MGLYIADKQAAIYKGSYKPVNVYHGSKKAAGWRTSEQFGNTLTWSDTYDDTIYSASITGDSTQYVAPSKNLLSMYGGAVYKTYGYLSQAEGTAQAIYRDYDVIIGVTRNGVIYYDCVQSYSIDPVTNTVSVRVKPGYAYYGVGFKIKATPGQNFAFTEYGATAMLGWGFYDADGVYLTNGVATTATAPDGAAFMWVVVMPYDAEVDTTYASAQVELGATSTAFVPAVRARPSPDYPLSITSTGESGGVNFDIAGYGGQTFTTNQSIALRSLPDGTRDTWDAASGTLTRRVGARTFTGAESFSMSTLTNTLRFAWTGTSYGSQSAMCSHFAVTPDTADTQHVAVDSNLSAVYFYVDKTLLADQTISGFKTWLAAQQTAGKPVKLYYKLASPTVDYVTPLTLPTYPHSTTLTCTVPVTASARVVDKII